MSFPKSFNKSINYNVNFDSKTALSTLKNIGHVLNVILTNFDPWRQPSFDPIDPHVDFDPENALAPLGI